MGREDGRGYVGPGREPRVEGGRRLGLEMETQLYHRALWAGGIIPRARKSQLPGKEQEKAHSEWGTGLSPQEAFGGRALGK